MEQSIQVTPITEGEMSTLRNLFAKFADTITDASHMRGEIEELRNQFNAIRQDAEFLRMRNRELDEQVTEVRRQRDEALAELEAIKRNSNRNESEIEGYRAELVAVRGDLSQVQSELIQTRRERDDASYARLEAEERMSKAREWIESITRLFNNPPVL